MAPIIAQSGLLEELPLVSVALILIGSLGTVAGIALTIVLCACGEKKKEEGEPPPPEEPPKEEPAPAEAPPPEVPAEKSAKTAVEAKSLNQSMTGAAKQATDLQLMSRVGDGPTMTPGGAGAGKASLRSAPSLQLMDPKSTVKATSTSKLAASTTGGKSVSAVATGKSVVGGKSVSVTGKSMVSTGGKSVSVAGKSMVSAKSMKSATVTSRKRMTNDR